MAQWVTESSGSPGHVAVHTLSYPPLEVDTDQSSPDLYYTQYTPSAVFDGMPPRAAFHDPRIRNFKGHKLRQVDYSKLLYRPQPLMDELSERLSAVAFAMGYPSRSLDVGRAANMCTQLAAGSHFVVSELVSNTHGFSFRDALARRDEMARRRLPSYSTLLPLWASLMSLISEHDFVRSYLLIERGRKAPNHTLGAYATSGSPVAREGLTGIYDPPASILLANSVLAPDCTNAVVVPVENGRHVFVPVRITRCNADGTYAITTSGVRQPLLRPRPFTHPTVPVGSALSLIRSRRRRSSLRM